MSFLFLYLICLWGTSLSAERRGKTIGLFSFSEPSFPSFVVCGLVPGSIRRPPKYLDHKYHVAKQSRLLYSKYFSCLQSWLYLIAAFYFWDKWRLASDGSWRYNAFRNWFSISFCRFILLWPIVLFATAAPAGAWSTMGAVSVVGIISG